MKYVIVIPDGAADEPQASLGGKTPLEAANTRFHRSGAQPDRLTIAGNTLRSRIPRSTSSPARLMLSWNRRSHRKAVAVRMPGTAE